jgi:pimeloyl-ACP methyl ester carboxylesterase
MQTLTLDVDGGPMAVDISDPSAPAGQPPLLLIHGWGGSGRYWQATVERIGGERRVVVPDLPGVGRSLPVRRARDISDQVAAIEQLIDHLAIDRLHIIGHSMGAAVAILLADRRPALVQRLLLTAVSFPRSDAERAAFLAIMGVAGVAMYFRAAWMADVRWLVQQSARRFFYQVPDDDALLRAGFLDYLRMDRDTAIATARSAVGSEIVAAARRLQMPVLLVAGRQDQAMPTDNVELTGAAIPNCEVRWIERCGHLPMVERADEYAAIARAFFERA